MKKNHVIIAIVLLSFALPAYAYLDPGSGSIILQGILAAIAGMLAAIKLYWKKLKAFVTRLFTSQSENKKPQDKKNNE